VFSTHCRIALFARTVDADLRGLRCSSGLLIGRWKFGYDELCAAIVDGNTKMLNLDLLLILQVTPRPVHTAGCTACAAPLHPR
jgi:hypothetical protein